MPTESVVNLIVRGMGPPPVPSAPARTIREAGLDASGYRCPRETSAEYCWSGEGFGPHGFVRGACAYTSRFMSLPRPVGRSAGERGVAGCRVGVGLSVGCGGDRSGAHRGLSAGGSGADRSRELVSAMDLMIVWKTAGAVLRGHGAY